MANARYSAPMRATIVKRAYEPGPAATCCRPGWADYSSGSSSQLPGSSRRAARGSSWSARSRAAARTNELDAGKRRKIIGGEEGFGCGWLVRYRVRVPGAGWRSGLTSTHPAPPVRRLPWPCVRDRAAQSCDRARPAGRLMPN